MKWYNSLKAKNIFFFVIMSVLFVLSVSGVFSMIKEKRLITKTHEAITIATNDVVNKLLVEQQKNEQIVRDMAAAAAVHPSKDIVKKMLHDTNEKDIVSGGLWFEPHVIDPHRKQEACFFQRNKNLFTEIKSYEELGDVSFRQMEFYVLGRNLKENDTFWTKVYIDPVTKVRMVTVVSPIYRNKIFIGVASLDVKLSLNQDKIFAEILQSKEKYFFLSDRVGTLIMNSKNLPFHAKSSSVDSINLTYLDTLLPHAQEGNEATAKGLIEASSDFSLSEAKQIAYELYHKKNRHEELIKRNSIVLEDDSILHESSVVASFYFPHTGWTMVIALPEHVIFKDTLEIYSQLIRVMVVFAMITALLGYFLVRHSIVKPLESISDQLKKNKMDEDALLVTKDKGEIGHLVENFNERSQALSSAHEKAAINERLLLQQSKMAAMGEMLDAVAHQWKQPLNALSMHSDLMGEDYKEGAVNEAYVEQFQEDIQTQIRHMTDTLSTFRTFFRPSSELKNFMLLDVIEEVLLLAKDELLKNGVEVSIVRRDALALYGSENEFKHLVLNIINNAKDAFNDNNIQERKIMIRLIKEADNTRLEIEDSAGGIPQDVIHEIFKAHFTTKEESEGTGIGLYMSTQIANKHHATLQVVNQNDGACFRVLFSCNSFPA